VSELPSPTLGDGVVTLRAWTEADAPAIEPVCGDPAVCQFTNVPLVYSAEMARAWIARHHERRRAGEAAVFAIVGDDDGRVLGNAILLRFDWEARVGEIGYWLLPAARGRGAATRAAALLAAWAFDELGLELLEFDVVPGNVASQQVVGRLGAERLPGTVVHQWNGRGWEMLRYVLRRDQLQGTSSA
jgi:[ribosomal protein S5]-alanine N-acetyltransferase